MPPALDDQMTKNALSLLSYSPILLLLNGYWMLSNRQIFASDINALTTMTETMLTGHTVGSFTFYSIDYAYPMLMLGVVSLILIFI